MLQRMSRDVREWLGFGMFWGWNLCIFWSEVVLVRPPDLSSGGMFRVEALLAIVGTLVVLAVAGERLSGRIGPLSAITVVAAVSGQILAASHVEGAQVLSSIGFVLIGVAYAMWELLWATRYREIPTSTAWKTSVPFSLCAGIAIFIVAELLPGNAGFFLAVCLPVLSILLLNSLVKGGQQKTQGEDPHPARLRAINGSISSRLLAVILIFGITLGFVTEIVVVSFPGYPQFSPVAFSIVLVAMFAIAVMNIRMLDSSVFQFAHYLIVPLIATALLILAILREDRWMPVVTTVNVAVYLLGELYFWSILAAQTKLRSADPFRCFGLGQAFKVIGLLTGMVVVYYLQDYPGSYETVMSTIMLYLISIAALITNNPASLMYSESELVSILEKGLVSDESQERGPVSANSLDEALHTRCVFLCESYSLSTREAEVLELLVSGFRLKAIADELSITENTVKVHTRHIYHKLGVHNRQELISLFKSSAF